MTITEDFQKCSKYRFLFESTTIDSTTFSYKTAFSKANIETNRMGSTKWTYH